MGRLSSLKPNPRIQGLFRDLLSHFRILDVTTDIAAHAGRMQGFLQANGKTRTPADMLIAATAAVNKLTLVTRNVQKLRQACDEENWTLPATVRVARPNPFADEVDEG